MPTHIVLGKTSGTFGRVWLTIVIVFTASLLPGSAAATLGGDMESVDRDQSVLNASQQIAASTQSFTVYELRPATGAVVREYLSLAGNVFAVAWKGTVPPDLRQILGASFGRYAEAAQRLHGGHGHLSIRRQDLVVESNGQRKAFFGRAYLPQALPPDIDVDDLH